ncbi:uncharacterized protein LOC133182478 [Saccostrea echinata]|uniref:uncharacterized protein LOC133182478 n=1 Tax=Saccostrea echinata TaxID=191078 RepID=UPI002A8386E2|nr:uncharacterized protein LOC133182478 [Saccostrea echinata]
MQQLLLYKGFTPIGNYFDKFVLKDYDLDERQLQANKFVFVHRSSKSFQGSSFHWCFTCSCNNTRSSLVNALSWSVDISHDAFLQRYPRCIHIDAVSFLMERYDSREDLQPEDHSYSLHCYQSQVCE